MNDTPYAQMRLNRAQQRYLGLYGQPVRHGLAAEDPLARVECARSLLPFFHARLEGGGSYQFGALFGYRAGTSLKIEHALPAGYGPRPLFDLDASYLLGASDAFQQCHPDIDWTGIWLMRPDSCLPHQREIEDVLEEARATRLLAEELCLMWAGWEDGVLVCLPYVLSEPGGVAVPLGCNIGYMLE
ncbi:hypothetical protein [Deinococcus fonticola]|uniref:hypothetical protein n=1 Tax=Deinococcus fonticola TaxID=2528713 RepID=UPI001074EB4E|nr:hypothetical protein [Deinococcus fonticola]